MKHHIYSIPLAEALEAKCGCILCNLEEKFEEQAVDYFLGASMMEPDAREITNEKGFCRRHLKKMFEKPNKLSLALTLETHVKELEECLEIKKKEGHFSKETTAFLTSEDIYETVRSCALCDKLNSQLNAAAGNISYLWSKNDEFRIMLEKTDDVLCLEHCALAIKMCDGEISSFKKNEYINMLINKQKKSLSKLYENLHNFTLSFDYRNSGKPLSPEEKSSVQTAVKQLTKF